MLVSLTWLCNDVDESRFPFLHDFDPAQSAVAWEKLEPLDQYMLLRARELTTKVLGWYEEFESHRIYHALNEFAIVDLSSLYADVLKDRLYTFAPNSRERPLAPRLNSSQVFQARIAQ